MIYDACYTDEEYHDEMFSKRGWGHSTWQEALRLANVANVKHPIMFHHDPDHGDKFLESVEMQVKAAYPKACLAREGMVINLLGKDHTEIICHPPLELASDTAISAKPVHSMAGSMPAK